MCVRAWRAGGVTGTLARAARIVGR